MPACGNGSKDRDMLIEQMSDFLNTVRLVQKQVGPQTLDALLAAARFDRPMDEVSLKRLIHDPKARYFFVRGTEPRVLDSCFKRKLKMIGRAQDGELYFCPAGP